MAAKATAHRGSPKAAKLPAVRHRGAVAPGGPAAHVLALQRSAGNAAVVALLQSQVAPLALQRQPTPAADLTSGMSQEDAEHIADEVQEDYTDFYNALMRANVIPNTTQYRHNLMLQLDAIGMDAAVDRGVFTDPLNHMNDITLISEKLREAKEKLRHQHNYSKTLWVQFDAAFDQEKAQLGLGTFVEQSALGVLSDSCVQAKQRTQALGEYAVAEDFVHVVNMLNKKTHLQIGADKAAREEQQLNAEVDAVTREMEGSDDDDPSLWSQVWSVVGWDSWTDFAKDMLYTAATFGASKYYRGAKRGKKAMDLAKAAQGARKLKYLKRLDKLKDIKDVSERLVTAVAAQQAEISSLVKWARGNASALARKIVTDLVSDQATGGVRGGASTVISRINKGYVQALVDEWLNVSEDQAKRYVKLSHIALLAGKDDSHRRMMKAFLSVAVRRRGLTNLIDAVITKTGTLDVPTDFPAAGIDVANIAITTAREVINDMLNGLPYIDKYKTWLQAPIEAALKSAQKFAQDALPR